MGRARLSHGERHALHHAADLCALSGHPVSVGALGADEEEAAAMAHVEVTREAALFVVAPTTANTLAKLARGIADDWLTTHFVACQAPVVIAPAMNQRMWADDTVQENLRALRARGAVIVEPEEGELACGEHGPGRLAAPDQIVHAGLELLARRDRLRGRRVLVTSGPTQEDVDPVRYVGNRSSGKMGHALAEQAARQGAEVVLVSGPTSLVAPGGCRVVAVRTAQEMADAVRAELPACDVAIYAAAVADFRPAQREAEKIRREGRDELVLTLERCPDVLGESVASDPEALLVGFAAETTEDLEAAGRAKLVRKGCDLLVANRVGGEREVFGADDNEGLLLSHDAKPLVLSRDSKSALAVLILDEVRRRLEAGGLPRRVASEPVAEEDA